ncbi:hypothetical protein QBC38DRAFT_465223 [Podospora fimiseda]|uniref:RGS domain-containing protein n=1 Tax=Podospora fimiseda TaxID=252190 RepID=A0AAN7H1T9_9PEZI|nr:hypothetical protein QBC38DRAFT_465223 [Podospora fimiseda]
MIPPRDESPPQPTKPPIMLGSEFGTTPNTKPVPCLNAIGIWWIIYGFVWTALVLAGMIFLFLKRKTPTVRLRGLPLTFGGIILLHLYWITVQIGYSVGPLAPEVAEFWIMSIWYPFGIALFQAGNSQFLHVAKAQSRFAMPLSQMISKFDEKRAVLPKKQWFLKKMLKLNGGKKKSLARQVGEDKWWNFFLPNEYQARMFTFVSMGMMVQFLVVIIIFLISRKFHSSFGIPGTEVHGSTPMEIAMKQGRGWEWWPSLFWQFIWSWIIAPIIIWRSRRIRDTHGWQLQTIACCVAGLHAAPMWLIALYVPGMAPVNAYFIPPQWIALSISVIEIFTIFIPCYQVRKDAILFKQALATRQDWEKRHPTQSSFKFSYDSKSTSSFSTSSRNTPLSPTSTKVVSDSGGSRNSISFNDPWKKSPLLESSSTSPQQEYDLSHLINDDSILSKTALDLVLAKNPEPLRQFSARRDFSGENIAFLTAVSEWRSSLPSSSTRHYSTASTSATPSKPADHPDQIRLIYTRALLIYTEFISNRDAEFPINIGFEIRRALEGIFERAARKLLGESSTSSATPFDDNNNNTVSLHQTKRSDSRSSETAIMEMETPQQQQDTASASDIYQGDIPPAFDANVFEKAYEDIRYLVLTNTWPKYVREWRTNSSSLASSSSGSSDAGGGGTGSNDGLVAAAAGNGGSKKTKKRSGTDSTGTMSSQGSLWSLKGAMKELGIKG